MSIKQFPNKGAGSDEIFQKFMHLICKRDSEITYRLKSDAGEGIMRRYSVAKGVEVIYSEIENYFVGYQEEKRLIKYLEIMYMVDGHAEFEMENRRCATANRGDVLIFNSKVATKNCTIAKGGMRCISIVVFIDDLADLLNKFFETNTFDKNKIFKEALEAKSCICFPASSSLECAFSSLMQLPETYTDFNRKLLTLQVILSLLNRKEGTSPNYQYFSKDTGNRVHEARKMLGEDLSNDIRIEDISKKVNINRTTLQRVFKQMYGVTMFEYRTQVRMQEAKNLLLDPSASVTEIAGICGYTNASKFSAAFKKVTGVLPGDFRRMQS